MHDYRTWLRAQRYAPTTIRNYSNYLTRSIQTLNLTTATTDELTTYCSTLTPGCAIGTRKALIAWYTYRGRTRRNNPAIEIVVPPTPKRRPRAHSPEARDQFICAAHRLGGLHETIGALFYFTGARFSSVRYARWHQFDLESREPTWEAVVKAANRSGPRTHVIPLHPTLVDVLCRWARTCPSRDWVFPGGAAGGVIGENALRDAYREVAEKIDLTSVPHQQRHSLATALYDHTGDLVMVQEVLGHSDLNTARGYTDVRTSRVRSALVGLPAPSL